MMFLYLSELVRIPKQLYDKGVQVPVSNTRLGLTSKVKGLFRPNAPT